MEEWFRGESSEENGKNKDEGRVNGTNRRTVTPTIVVFLARDECAGDV